MVGDMDPCLEWSPVNESRYEHDVSFCEARQANRRLTYIRKCSGEANCSIDESIFGERVSSRVCADLESNRCRRARAVFARAGGTTGDRPVDTSAAPTHSAIR